MKLDLKFHQGEVASAQVTYRGNELALRYVVTQQPGQPVAGIQASIDARSGVRPERWLGIADTLVLVFTGPDARFVGLDAYTNIHRWARTTRLEMPEVNGRGWICLAPPPRETDRMDLGIVPAFEYSEEQARLGIRFGRPAAQHYQVSTCLIVGVDDAGIATLDLSNLRVE